jgi:hypothetical protein
MAKKTTRNAAKRSPVKKAAKAAPKKAPAHRAAKKRAPARKAAPARKRVPVKKRAPAKKAATRSGRKAPNKSGGSRKRAPKTAYEKRNAAAKKAGYESYWDERKSRERAREALEALGHKNPNATDAETMADVDQLGTLGRGKRAIELYRETRELMSKYEPAPSDSQIWAMIRIFYKPRSRR